VATDLLESKDLDRLKENNSILTKDVWFLRDVDAGKMIEDLFLDENKLDVTAEPLCIEAKDSNETGCLVSYKKGCGKWINTAKGCPFSNAGGLAVADMTASEHRVIELWRKMATLYSAVI
jgi:hypothetical protein